MKQNISDGIDLLDAFVQKINLIDPAPYVTFVISNENKRLSIIGGSSNSLNIIHIAITGKLGVLKDGECSIKAEFFKQFAKKARALDTITLLFDYNNVNKYPILAATELVHGDQGRYCQSFEAHQPHIEYYRQLSQKQSFEIKPRHCHEIIHIKNKYKDFKGIYINAEQQTVRVINGDGVLVYDCPETLTEMEKEDGSRTLSNARVNNILWPLISIMIVAAEEFKFDYPFSRYRALREQKADSSPMTLQEVKRFLDSVEPEWYDYFLLRFMTGMRSCEVHGLQLKHIDFEHRLIKVRQNVVNGEITDVKTPKSRRDLPINDILSSCLERITATLSEPDDFLFTNDAGEPLDTRYIGKQVWHPTLKRAGLKTRRPYETRHTAAVLHLAAHENPLYVSQLLGHSNTRLLFEIYAPYVFNAASNDGSAFSDLMRSGGVIKSD